jgi:hypothetical protein
MIIALTIKGSKFSAPIRKVEAFYEHYCLSKPRNENESRAEIYLEKRSHSSPKLQADCSN